MSAAPGAEFPTISVVIPTRDRPTLLRAAVASVREQSQPPLEIIVVDEASTPPVSAIDLPGIRVIRHDRPLGPAAARNRGAAEATGDYVAFLDDDDLWHRNKLKVISECLAARPDARAVFHGLTSASRLESHEHTELIVLESTVDRMLGKGPPHPSAWTVERKTHLSVRFNEEYPAAADLDYNVRLAEMTTVIELPTVLGYHTPKVKQSSIGVDKRIAGRLQFRAEHRRYFVDEKYERHHRLRLAHLYRRGGHRLVAFGLFVRLALTQPLDAGAWKGMIGCLLPRSIVASVLRRR